MRAKVFILGLLFAVFFLASSSYSQVPQMINYQGKLTDASGNLINGNYNMTFSIYEVATGGTPLWTETQNAVPVENGVFSVLLGSVNPIPFDVFNGAIRYLEVAVAGTPMTPRKEIVSVGYAFRAETANLALQADDDWAGAGTGMMYTNYLTDNVGIGTTSPQHQLEVREDLCVRGPFSGSALFLKSFGGAAQISAGMTMGVGEVLHIHGGGSIPLNPGGDLLLDGGIGTPGGNIILASEVPGNVGIGTTAPTERLHIFVPSPLSPPWILVEHQPLIGLAGISLRAGSATWSVENDGGVNNQLQFAYNTAPQMVITNEGNVGIGTPAPETKLHITNSSPSDQNTTIRLHDFGFEGFEKTVDLTCTAADFLGNFSGLKVNNNIWGTENLFTTGIVYAGVNGTGLLFGTGNKLNVNGSASIGANYYGYDAPSSGLIVEGNVGIGTESPTEKLDVNGTVQMTGFKMPTGAFAGFVLTSTATGVGTWAPPAGGDDLDWEVVLNSTFKRDVFTGHDGAYPEGNVYIGIPTSSASNQARLDVDGSGDNRLFGIRGKGGTGSFSAGVHGDADGAVYGVMGYSGTGAAVCGWASTALAGYFIGNVNITGNLSKGSGSFKVDHPLDPENKYLYHSFVESPDMKNVYDGVVVLDAKGEAKVELPNYFEALNKDFRYQLTCIGGFAPVYVAEEISGNSFSIAGGQPSMKVSWQVTGIRKDRYAEVNRIQIEVDKPAKERGKYLHPEAYGLGAERGIHYEEQKLLEMEREKGKIK